MSSTGTEPITDTWMEVQFAQPSDPAVQSGNRQAMEKLLIDAQHESGQSSLAQSGSASPAIAGSRSPLAGELHAAAAGPDASLNLQSSGDWQRDWPARSQHGCWQKCQTWRFVTLRKTALMRCPASALLLGLWSHAASFLLGAASMYIVIRSVGSQQQQQRAISSVGVMSRSSY